MSDAEQISDNRENLTNYVHRITFHIDNKYDVIKTKLIIQSAKFSHDLVVIKELFSSHEIKDYIKINIKERFNR
jgi:hypothetical protein